MALLTPYLTSVDQPNKVADECMSIYIFNNKEQTVCSNLREIIVIEV